jgi:hypothetical protein
MDAGVGLGHSAPCWRSAIRMAATRASSSRPDLVLTGRDEVLRTAATRASVSPSAIPAATVTVAFAGTATPATPEQMARRSSSPSVPAGLLPALPGLVCVPPAPRPPARARALRHPGGPLPPLPPALDGGEVRLAPRPETCPFGQSLYAAPFAVQTYHRFTVISICSRVTSPAERVIVARDVEARAGRTCWASYDCSAALRVRPPVADGGGPAIGASPEAWAPIEQAVLAAVQADPATRAHLFGPRPRLARH